MPRTPIGVLGMIAEPTGTDGRRVLCRQFYTSSTSPPLPSRALQKVLSEMDIPPIVETQRRSGPSDIPSGIPETQ